MIARLALIAPLVLVPVVAWTQTAPLPLDTFVGQVVARLRALYPALLSTVYDVRTYGAVCDGNTDDAPAVNATLAAVPSRGGTVQLCPTFKVAGSMNVIGNNITVRGDGINTTQIAVVGHSFDVFNVTGQATELSGFSIVNYGGQTGGKYGIKDSGAGQRLLVRDVAMTGLYSGILTQGSEARIEHVRIYNSNAGGGYAIQINQTAGELVEIYNSVLSGGQRCILAQRGTAITVAHTQATGCAVAFEAAPAAGLFVNYINLNDFWADSSTYAGILLNGTAGTIGGVRISASWMSGSGTLHGLGVSGVVRGLVVSNNEIIGNAGNGVDVASGGTYTGLMIDGNRIAGNVTGVAIGSGVTGFSITGNVIGPSGGFPGNSYAGIYIGGSNNEYVVTGNRACRNHGETACGGTTGVVDGGGGASKVVANNLQ